MSHFPRLLGKLPERFRRKYEALTDTKVEVLRVHAVSPVSP